MIDENTKKRLQYALIKVEACMNDPLLEANMLHKMKKAYDQEGIKMPAKIIAFYENELKRIAPKLKEKYDKLIAKKEKIVSDGKQPEKIGI